MLDEISKAVVDQNNEKSAISANMNSSDNQ
jgi:hypothetical protein